MYKVYAKCFGDKLEINYESKIKYRCHKYIRNLAKAGRPTHFYFVSKLSLEQAYKRYMP